MYLHCQINLSDCGLYYTSGFLTFSVLFYDVTTLNTVMEQVSDLPCTNIASTSIEHMLAFARDL